MALHEKADMAARASGFYPPEGGRDSNGRPFSVDIEDLPNCPDSNPTGCDTGGPAWAVDISDLSSLSSLSDSDIEMTKSKRVYTSQTTSGSAELQPSRSLRVSTRRWLPSVSLSPPPRRSESPTLNTKVSGSLSISGRYQW
jgi:hypothetical protein